MFYINYFCWIVIISFKTGGGESRYRLAAVVSYVVIVLLQSYHTPLSSCCSRIIRRYRLAAVVSYVVIVLLQSYHTPLSSCCSRIIRRYRLAAVVSYVVIVLLQSYHTPLSSCCSRIIRRQSYPLNQSHIYQCNQCLSPLKM